MQVVASYEMKSRYTQGASLYAQLFNPTMKGPHER